jgi:hypothetical protein
MTSPLVVESTIASTDPAAAALAKRYGIGERLRVVYQAPQQATSEPEDDPAGEVAVSDSTTPDQALSLPTIPSGAVLHPPAVKAEKAKKVKRPKIKSTGYIAQYRIAGEMFYVEIKSRRIFIRHPKWSLMGAGKDLEAAELALLDEAGIVVRVYDQIPARDLDEEAEKMLNFARRIA